MLLRKLLINVNKDERLLKNNMYIAFILFSINLNL